MTRITDPLQNLPTLNQVAVPDLWQQQAVAALRAGRDVIVHAPTGAGKTLIFELWSQQGKNRGQAIYTVPTRALANDKLAEWRARGWNVGIATGDLAENLEAPVLVATLETQKSRLIRGEGPALLVVDEYQMLGDPDRGLNYELALALAPPQTQLLLLSGSVANPHDAVKWLQRLGRQVTLIRHEERPVPLEEIFSDSLQFHIPQEVRGYWPRFVAKALAEDLGPILIFAPRRNATEQMAAELARNLPTPNPLTLTPEQKLLVGDDLARLLRSRICYHHSGLSYAARAGVIEPLAKAGQLRVVVATMGLAAGINFSLRSVALAGDSYRRDYQEFPLRADEILQMFGRAGRRGIDEIGYVLVTQNDLRLRDGRPCHLARGGLVDWSALLGVMALAADNGREPFAEAVRVQDRLFTTKPIVLGVEEALKNPAAPCGLMTDAERARHVRHRIRQILNSRGEWQNYPPELDTPVSQVFITNAPATAPPRSAEHCSAGRETNDPSRAMLGAPDQERGRPARSGSNETTSHERSSATAMVRSAEHCSARRTTSETSRAMPGAPPHDHAENPDPLAPIPPRSTPAPAESTPTAAPESPPPPPLPLHNSSLIIHPSLRPALTEPAALEKIGTGGICLLAETEGVKTFGRAQTVADLLPDDRVVLAKWARRATGWKGRNSSLAEWREKIEPLVTAHLAKVRTPVVRFAHHPDKIVALVSVAQLTLRVPVDAHGVALWHPPTRMVEPPDCARCPHVPICTKLSAATGVAMLWRRLGLVDAAGAPTRRGRVVSRFSQGDGLAIAVALEDERYPLKDLIYDLADLDGGFRFCGEDNRWGGRLAMVCQSHFGIQNIPGYLENGVPPGYGAGAENIVAAVHKNPLDKTRWVSPFVGVGDIDRVIIEWRSLLRQTAHAPPLEWPRWTAFQALARAILNQTESPTLTELPPLEYAQTKRIDHRLILRRH